MNKIKKIDLNSLKECLVFVLGFSSLFKGFFLPLNNKK